MYKTRDPEHRGFRIVKTFNLLSVQGHYRPIRLFQTLRSFRPFSSKDILELF